MVSRVYVTLKLLYILSIWVPSSKGLPQRIKAALGGNERCNHCEDLMKMGASSDIFLRALNRSNEPDLPPEHFLDKAEDFKKAAALFLKYCSLNCKKVVEPPEKENLIELATEEFWTPWMLVENPSADSEPTNTESTSPRTTMRTKVERRFFRGDSHNGVPPTESDRFSSYSQNQPKLPDTENTNTKRSESDTETSETPEPGTDAPFTTEVAPITTVEINAAEAPIFSTSEISSTTSRVMQTIAEITPRVTTSKPITTESGQNTKLAVDADYSDIEDLILEWDQITSDENAAELLSCLMDEILKDLELTVNPSIRLFFRNRCENASELQTLLPLTEDSTQVYSEQLIDALTAEDIFGDLEDISLRSGLAAGKDDTQKAHNYANGPSAISGHRKSFRVPETKDVSSSPESVVVLREELQRREHTPEKAK